MLDTAAVTKIFSSNKEVKKIFADLRSTYKLLCEDAHTATNQNMAKITSLSEFPYFEKGGAKSCSTVFTAVTMNITATFCILFITFFHEMHHMNKVNILNSLPRKLKAVINSWVKNIGKVIISTNINTTKTRLRWLLEPVAPKKPGHSPYSLKCGDSSGFDGEIS